MKTMNENEQTEKSRALHQVHKQTNLREHLPLERHGYVLSTMGGDHLGDCREGQHVLAPLEAARRKAPSCGRS